MVDVLYACVLPGCWSKAEFEADRYIQKYLEVNEVTFEEATTVSIKTLWKRRDLYNFTKCTRAGRF